MLKENLEYLSAALYGKEIGSLSVGELHNVLGRAVMAEISEKWQKDINCDMKLKRAYYFSAEFLVGRAVFNNLLSLNLLSGTEELLKPFGRSLSELEEIPDAALGNGGLGRLAACFLDSAATLSLPLAGYGVRYRFGLFKQYFEDGFQKEAPDDWLKWGDPWEIRREEESQIVEFSGGNIKAVPYDMPIIGYNRSHILSLRLWQAEPIEPLDFELFGSGKFCESRRAATDAFALSALLYPNDSTPEGKMLRLRQQYFFCSASLKDIISRHKKAFGTLDNLPDYVSIQLNDTHPVISIPEFIRLALGEGMTFEKAFFTAQNIFNYTNHTVMAEALEKWELELIAKLSPSLCDIIKKLDKLLSRELTVRKAVNKNQLAIIQNGKVNMAYLACFCSKTINGVAKIHTEILKADVLKDWHTLYPKKIQNKTNGITQRRWLHLANRPLCSLLEELMGSCVFLTDLNRLEELKKYADDEKIITRFAEIKRENKALLSDYISKKEGKHFNPDWMLDVQIKRLHEYKRQLLNALCLLEIYFEIKEGSLKDFHPTLFLFGAKAAPGYKRAKGIIKLINELSRLIEEDEKASQYMKVIFISDYNVSYAEKIVAAADLSEQISMSGTEASGTGNMKLMLSGAPTLGTFDGANIEIVEAAGRENNYIFGLTHSEIIKAKKNYEPKKLYNSNKKIKRCLDALIDGTLSDEGRGYFRELYDSILEGTDWHEPDAYCLLLDFEDYLSTRLRANRDFKNPQEFYKKSWLNMASAGRFSSDRTVSQYAEEIWDLDAKH